MAFSEEEKHKIIRVMGWPANTLVESSMSYIPTIAQKILNVPAPAEEAVRELLTRIDELDTDLKTAIGSTGVKKIDDIEFFGNNEGSKLETLRQERRNVLRELGSTLDLQFGPGARSSMMGRVR